MTGLRESPAGIGSRSRLVAGSTATIAIAREVGDRSLGLAVLTFIAAVAVVWFATACGTDSVSESGDGAEAAAIGRQFDVRASDRAYSIDDLKAATGVKANKEYDIAELPSALAAWRLIYNRQDYEVRFYPDHATAVDEGIPYAEHVTGEGAVVVGDAVIWEEGAKDRRRCSRNEKTPHSGCSYSSRYWDFVVLGNMVMMCEGLESEEAIRNCDELIAAIP